MISAVDLQEKEIPPIKFIVDGLLPHGLNMLAAPSKYGNQDFDWTGAHTIKVYKITTSDMNDYDRDGSTLGIVPGDGGSLVKWSRYGAVAGLDASTEEMQLKRDRSFTFVIDKLDEDETGEQLEAAAALARQTREKVIPEVDTYTYGVMCANASNKPAVVELTVENIYLEILKGSEALDDAEAPETGRVLVLNQCLCTIPRQLKASEPYLFRLK